MGVDMDKKIECNDLLYYIAMFLFVTSNILDLSMLYITVDIQMIVKLMKYIACAMFCLKIVLTPKYGRKDIYCIAAGLLIVLLAFAGSRNKGIILMCIPFIASYKISSRSLIKLWMILQCSFMLLFVLGSRIGLFLDYVPASKDRIRHFLGYGWTTTAPILFLFVTFCYIYLKNGKLKLWDTLLLLAVNTYFYVMTNTRFSFLVAVASILVFGLFSGFIERGRLISKNKNISLGIPFLCAFFSCGIHALYNENSEFWRNMNDLLSQRLWLGHDAIEKYGYTLFGQPIEWIGYSFWSKEPKFYNYVDCSYLQLVLEYGIILLVLILILYGSLLVFAWERKQYCLYWIVIFILLFSITEPRLLNLSFNPFILLAMTEWSSDVHKKKVNAICGE